MPLAHIIFPFSQHTLNHTIFITNTIPNHISAINVPGYSNLVNYTNKKDKMKQKTDSRVIQTIAPPYSLY
jgi:hypothetical protein